MQVEFLNLKMKLVFFLTTVTTAMAAGTGYSGSFSSGNGQGYGYSGSFGSGGSGAGGSFPPGVPQFNFNNLFSQYFDVFRKFNQDLANTKISAYAYSLTNANFNNKAQARTSLTFHGKGLQSQQNMFGGGFGFPGGHPTGGYPTYSGGGGFGGGYSGSGGHGAFASGSVGPGGAHQTASVYPQNPNIPNVNTRFGASPGGNSYGVFTSSQSVSSNVDGKPVTYQQASTTINDNGKVSTYSVHNP